MSKLSGMMGTKHVDERESILEAEKACKEYRSKVM